MSEVGLKPRAEIRSHQGRKGRKRYRERRGPSTQSPRAAKHTPHRKGQSEISYTLRKAGLWEARVRVGNRAASTGGGKV